MISPGGVGPPLSPVSSSPGPDMPPLWKVKVELEEVLKDLQSSRDMKEDLTRRKFNFTKWSMRMTWRLLSDHKTRELLRTVDKPSQNKKWWHPSLSRSQAEKYLQSQQVGAFVVRIGNGKQFFALTLKSDIDKFDHYKIESRGEDGEDQWMVTGCSKKFLSLSSLVLHFSFLREMLPVPLSRDLVT